MKVFGIGTDLVDMSRIAKMVERYQEKFVKRILSEDEQACLKQVFDPVLYLAKRYAGKEAMAKAMGCGIGRNAAFNEISILNHPSGQPYVKLSGKAHEYALNQQFKEIHISLSDEKDYTLAFAVICS